MFFVLCFIVFNDKYNSKVELTDVDHLCFAINLYYFRFQAKSLIYVLYDIKET